MIEARVSLMEEVVLNVNPENCTQPRWRKDDAPCLKLQYEVLVDDVRSYIDTSRRRWRKRRGRGDSDNLRRFCRTGRPGATPPSGEFVESISLKCARGNPRKPQRTRHVAADRMKSRSRTCVKFF